MNTTALLDSALRTKADAYIEAWARRPRDGFDQDSAHSLAAGQAGDALAHAELAARGRTAPDRALRALARAAQGDISTSTSAGLYWGAPAVAFALHTAGPHRAHAKALATLHTHIARAADQRARRMLERIDRRTPTCFAEYDVLFGLTGLGAYLLRTAPGSPELARVLTALSGLARPLPLGRARVPGWWVDHDPHRSPTTPENGHANLGAAHGITGVLMLLSQAARAGVAAPGQMPAIEHLAGFLLDWSRAGPAGRWWPEHLTLAEYTARAPAQQGPARPSWCYGTPGIARAGQLAAAALNDRHMLSVFESALADCLSDPNQLATLADARLCHGWAGLFQTAWRASADAADPRIADLLPALAQRFTAALPAAPSTEQGLLDGDAGVVLALLTATDPTVETGWDACLLID